MSNRASHQELLRKLQEKYQPFLTGKNEFTYDGPSNWDIWETEKLKILFLVKEARLGYHPCVKEQPTTSRFSRSIARWKIAIKKSIINNEKILLPKNYELPKYNDDVAIVEVKKLNEEKSFSNNGQICHYANQDKDFLKRQIDLLSPNVIVCCSTFQSYNIIYQNIYTVKKKLHSVDKCNSWLLDNRLVIDFFHPSTFHKTSKYLFETIAELSNHDNIQMNIPNFVKQNGS